MWVRSTRAHLQTKASPRPNSIDTRAETSPRPWNAGTCAPPAKRVSRTSAEVRSSRDGGPRSVRKARPKGRRSGGVAEQDVGGEVLAQHPQVALAGGVDLEGARRVELAGLADRLGLLVVEAGQLEVGLIEEAQQLAHRLTPTRSRLSSERVIAM
jgi:hypothetical protein